MLVLGTSKGIYVSLRPRHTATCCFYVSINNRQQRHVVFKSAIYPSYVRCLYINTYVVRYDISALSAGTALFE